jgi:hypothetical protein
MKRFMLIGLMFVVLAACGPAPRTPSQELATPSADWTTIKMVQSGGIMGLLRTIQISRSGSFTLTDDRAGKNVNGQLSPAELSRLTDLAASLAFTPPSKPEMGCADCFIYNFEISSPTGTVTLQANDISLPESGLQPLVVFLQGIMEQALQ